MIISEMIYGFRGADVERFFQTVNSYPHKNYVLGQNYRSTPEIVEAANSLIKYNPQYTNKTIFSKKEHGEKIALMSNLSQEEEADHIASIIGKLIKSGQAEYSDVAVLYRNAFVSRAFEDSFRRHRIPYQLVNGISFYKRMEVQDILAFMTFFENPRNMEALDRIINIPKSGIGKKSIERINKILMQKVQKYAILDSAKAIDLLQEVFEDPSLKRVMAKGQAFLQRCKIVNSYLEEHTNVGEIIGAIVSSFNYENYLRSYDEETCSDRILNINELKNMAMSYDSSQEFLEDIMTVNPETENDEDVQVNAVQLMTMHASKGLEFPVVFIASANEGIIPSWRSNTPKAIQEERRLFYVAMTRAKENLVISSTRTVMQRGRIVHASPSQFISQIDESYIA